MGCIQAKGEAIVAIALALLAAGCGGGGGGSVVSTGGGVTSITGQLRPNAIYFGHFSGTAALTSILPDGSGKQDVGSLASGVFCVVPDPDHAAGLVFAAIPLGGSQYGIYRGTTLDPAAATQIVAPTFDDVSMLQAIPGGKVIAVAAILGVSQLVVSDGTTTSLLDEASSAAASPDGSEIAYTKSVGGVSDLFVRVPGVSTPTLVSTGGTNLYPAFSKDLKTIVFSSDRDATSDSAFDLYSVPATGGATVRLTNTPGLSELGASFNSTGTSVSCVGLSAVDGKTGIYVVSGSTEKEVLADITVGVSTYWSTPSGRSATAQTFAAQRLRPIKR